MFHSKTAVMCKAHTMHDESMSRGYDVPRCSDVLQTTATPNNHNPHSLDGTVHHDRGQLSTGGYRTLPAHKILPQIPPERPIHKLHHA